MWTEGLGITDYRNGLWLRSNCVPPELNNWFDKQYEYSGWYDSIQLVEYSGKIKSYCRMDYKGFKDWLEEFSPEMNFSYETRKMSYNEGWPDSIDSPFYTTPIGTIIKYDNSKIDDNINYKPRKQLDRYIAYIFEMHS
tara:strand:- start:3349 stop:3762 length:414 start_codon:yes stop_codon:yes gene_type:complete